ncbi:MAG: hypothetical protein Q7R53_02305 [bacterium]|nr:hypothetical protein [bacterium]
MGVSLLEAEAVFTQREFSLPPKPSSGERPIISAEERQNNRLKAFAEVPSERRLYLYPGSHINTNGKGEWYLQDGDVLVIEVYDHRKKRKIYKTEEPCVLYFDGNSLQLEKNEFITSEQASHRLDYETYRKRKKGKT